MAALSFVMFSSLQKNRQLLLSEENTSRFTKPFKIFVIVIQQQPISLRSDSLKWRRTNFKITAVVDFVSKLTKNGLMKSNET